MRARYVSSPSPIVGSRPAQPLVGVMLCLASATAPNRRAELDDGSREAWSPAVAAGHVALTDRSPDRSRSMAVFRSVT